MYGNTNFATGSLSVQEIFKRILFNKKDGNYEIVKR